MSRMLDRDDDPLTSTLRAIADEDSEAGASREVESNLRSTVRLIAKRRMRRAYVAAFALAAIWLVLIVLPGRRTTNSPSPNRTAASEVGTDFLPLMYGDLPVTGGQIVRLDVPRSALVTFGLASVDTISPSSSETVLADLLVGEDGVARAVRFVQQAAN